MGNYKLAFKDKIYELSEAYEDALINDEEKPITGITVSDILKLLDQQQDVDFDVEYYDQPCPSCLAGKEAKAKYFKFLEYHFYIFTKEGNYVTSSISKEYENISFNKLLKQKKVDNSYIVSIIICENCGEYSIEIEQCEV